MTEKIPSYDIPVSVLSIKDRKILKELFDHARTPFSLIAKRVGLSKEVVHYRVKKLMERGILLRFNTVIGVPQLGWQMYFINIRLRNVDNTVEEEIINAMTHHPNIAQVLKCMGSYDLILKVFVKDYIEANKVMKDLERKFKNHIGEYILNLIEQELPLPLSFLYEPFKIKEYAEIPRRDTGKKDTEHFPVSSIDLHL